MSKKMRVSYINITTENKTINKKSFVKSKSVLCSKKKVRVERQ